MTFPKRYLVITFVNATVNFEICRQECVWFTLVPLDSMLSQEILYKRGLLSKELTTSLDIIKCETLTTEIYAN